MRTNDGIVLADQLLQEGSSSPADVYLTENSPELVTLDEHGLLAKLDARDARPGARPLPTPRAATGSGSRGGSARSPTTRRSCPRASCRSRSSNWPSRSGRARSRSRRPTRTSRRSSARSSPRYGKQAARQLARRPQAQRPALPGRRVGRRGRQPRRRRDGHHQPLLLVSPAARGRRARRCTARCTSSPTTTSARSRTSPAPACSPRAGIHGRRRRSSASCSARPRSEILAHGYDFEYPTRPGISPNPQLTPLSLDQAGDARRERARQRPAGGPADPGIRARLGHAPALRVPLPRKPLEQRARDALAAFDGAVEEALVGDRGVLAGEVDVAFALRVRAHRSSLPARPRRTSTRP